MRQSVRAERRTDPQRLTQLVLDHPLGAAMLSGLLLATWGMVIDLPIAVVAGGGLTLAAIVWLVWRRGGPGYRWRRAMLRRFPKKRY